MYSLIPAFYHRFTCLLTAPRGGVFTPKGINRHSRVKKQVLRHEGVGVQARDLDKLRYSAKKIPVMEIRPDVPVLRFLVARVQSEGLGEIREREIVFPFPKNGSRATNTLRKGQGRVLSPRQSPQARARASPAPIARRLAANASARCQDRALSPRRSVRAQDRYPR